MFLKKRASATFCANCDNKILFSFKVFASVFLKTHKVAFTVEQFSSKIHTFRREKSSPLTSNELLMMLTKTNNQVNQEIANIMTYKVYTHRHTRTCIYTIVSCHYQSQRLFQC